MSASVSDDLLHVYLDGFASGAATVALAMYGDSNTEAADALAQTLVDQLKRTPSALDEIRREVRERLEGDVDGPARSITVPGGGK